MSEELGGEVLNTEAESQPEERTFSKYDVQKIVEREKANASDRTKRKLEAEYNERLDRLRAEKEEIARQLNGMGQSSQGNYASNNQAPFSIDEVVKKVRDDLSQDMQRQEMERYVRGVADSYASKMAAGSSKYEDFNDTIKDFEASSFPNLIFLAEKLDNLPDVMYDLIKNPSKLIAINTLAEKAPSLASAELNKLSASIKHNQEAQQSAQRLGTPSPLDRVQPSLISGGNGQMSFNDLRNADWLRG